MPHFTKLPVLRNLNYVAGLQVASDDLNDLQDAIIGARVAHFFEDFWKFDTDIWVVNADGTGTATVVQGRNYATLETSAVANDVTQIVGPNVGSFVNTAHRCRARVNFQGDSGTPMASRFDDFGLFNNSTYATRCAFFRDTASSNNLKVDVLGGSGTETFDTGLSPTVGTWYTLTLVILSTTQVYWSIHTDESAAPVAEATETLASAITNTDQLAVILDVQALTTSKRRLLVDYVSARVTRGV